MKKLIVAVGLAAVFASGAAAKDIELYGEIVAVDNAAKTITIASHAGKQVIQVQRHTKIKGDDCGAFGRDVRGSFTDLKTGMYVEVEALPAANMSLSAKEIEWKCGKMAY